MKRTIKIVIDCGERYCSPDPDKGTFCPQMMVRRMGTEWVCALFHNQDGSDIELKSDGPEGCLMRCKQCLEAEE